MSSVDPKEIKMTSTLGTYVVDFCLDLDMCGCCVDADTAETYWMTIPWIECVVPDTEGVSSFKSKFSHQKCVTMLWLS